MHPAPCDQWRQAAEVVALVDDEGRVPWTSVPLLLQPQLSRLQQLLDLDEQSTVPVKVSSMTSWASS